MSQEEAFRKAMAEAVEAFWAMDWESAAEAYARALEIRPEDTEALSGYALSRFYQGRYEEAARTFRRILEKNPKHAATWERLAQAYEAMGNMRAAAEAAMHSAEHYARQGQLAKAIALWEKATTWHPGLLQAHYLLARAYEHKRRVADAVREYLWVAALLQRMNKQDEALRMLQKAEKLAPAHPDIHRAMRLLTQGRPIPFPEHPKPPKAQPPTSPQLEPEKPEAAPKTPIDEAAEKALSALADLLFAQAEAETAAAPPRRISRLSEALRGSIQELTHRDTLILLIAQAVEAQTRKNWEAAAAELERVVHAGVRHPSLFYNLGWLYAHLGQTQKAISSLQQAVHHPDFALAAHLLLARQWAAQGHWKEAFLESLEALRWIDMQAVPEEQMATLEAYYDSLHETWLNKGEEAWKKVYENVQNLLNTPDWQERVWSLRTQAHEDVSGMGGFLAEWILEVEAPHHLEALQEVQALMRQGALDAAMETAHLALYQAPYFLPLHMLIGDILWQQGHMDQAVEKYITLARVHMVRGQATRATAVLEHARKMHPMYPPVYRYLIDLYLRQGRQDDALRTYLQLSDVYRQLANMEAAVQTLQEAETWARQANLSPMAQKRLLRARAALAEEQLDWETAQEVYRKALSLDPSDTELAVRWLGVFFRQGRLREALTHLREWMQKQGTTSEGLLRIQTVLEELTAQYGQHPLLWYQLGKIREKLGQSQAAIEALDKALEGFLKAQNYRAALQTTRDILRLNPPNAPDYREMLRRIQDELSASSPLTEPTS